MKGCAVRNTWYAVKDNLGYVVGALCALEAALLWWAS